MPFNRGRWLWPLAEIGALLLEALKKRCPITRSSNRQSGELQQAPRTFVR